jgi:hypothetical protein
VETPTHSPDHRGGAVFGQRKLAGKASAVIDSSVSVLGLDQYYRVQGHRVDEEVDAEGGQEQGEGQ